MAFSRQYTSKTEDRLVVMQSLNEQRLDGELCDVILVVGDEKFPSHKCLLSAASQYFRSMFGEGCFAESSSREVEICSVDCDALRAVLDMIYSGTVSVDLDNVYNILAASDLLLLDSGKKFCAYFLTEVLDSEEAISNVLYIHRAAQLYSLQSLERQCMHLIARKFPDILETPAFRCLTIHEVKQLVSSDNIQVADEYTMFKAVTLWIEDQVEDRQQHIDELMTLVRFPLVSSKDLVKAKCHPFMKSAYCQSLIEEALLYHLQRMKQSFLQSARTKPRLCSTDDCTIIYCLSGVKNFMCYIPPSDRWYSLAAPTDWPEDLSQNLSSLHSRLIAVGGLVYACYLRTNPEEVGNHIVKAVLRYDISLNTWTSCPLPEGASKQCLFVESNNVLYACSRDRIECFSESADKWDTVKTLDITPCDFVVPDDDWIHFFNLGSGIAQSVCVNGHRHPSVQTEVMTPNNNHIPVQSICKLQQNEVLLTVRDVIGISRRVFNVKTHMWKIAEFSKEPGSARGIPRCLHYNDSWQMVYNKSNNHMYILSNTSGLSDIPHSGDTKKRCDAVLPFYEVDLKGSSWIRLASLPEALAMESLQLCITNSNS